LKHDKRWRKGSKKSAFPVFEICKDGERVVVTEHNKIIAEIIEPEQQEADAEIEQKLLQLSREGEVILAKRNKSLAKKPVLTAAERSIDWETIYNEIQGNE
jgi:antitoxin (DNA-binding transcriptional repressor) of toxin-antitoxin stability system